ncbi:RluA family pseudouridine synthase [Pelagibacteraceae bacterium]|nr:RluA family pseudouridine synthase [Pelagibacteraceae bacterium]
MKKSYLINGDFISMRLDRWIKKNISDIPQSLIEKNIRQGNIKINNKKEKSSYKLQKNDKIFLYNFNYSSKKHKKKSEIYIPSKDDLASSSSVFIENNDNFAVINKPPGIAVQSGTKSLKNIIDIIKKTKEFEGYQPYTVHRIDKETTGILLIAKNRKYAQLFTTLFRLRKIKKKYLGIVMGEFDNEKGKLEDILYHFEGEKKISSKAITYYDVIDTNNGYSLLSLTPYTGRKHQLRKQLSLRGHFIIGDNKYKSYGKNVNKSDKLMLHAYKISFIIDNIKYNFTAKIPKDFDYTLKKKYLKNVLQ